MDVLIVRTKLQAIIALELLDREKISKRFIFISWLDHRGKETTQTENIYDNIKKRSFLNLEIVESEGFLFNFIKLYFISLTTSLLFSKFIFAIIDSNTLALVKKFNPLIRIESFDDGAANFVKISDYFKDSPLPDNKTLRRKALNFIFPNSCSHFLRRKISHHYSIYRNKENILEQDKTSYVDIDFSKYLLEKEKNLLKDFAKEELNILVGTTFLNEFKRTGINFLEIIQNEYVDIIDLIILHPRDDSDIKEIKSSRRFESPAEAIVDFFVKNHKVKKINLYHFRSSCIVSLLGKNKIDTVDLWTESKLSLWDDPSRDFFQ